MDTLLANLNGDGATMGVQIAVGVALLMLGRRLYWLFVAGVGFVVVMTLAQEYVDVGPEWLDLALGIGAGILGGLFAIFLQRVAVALAGFGASAYFAREVLTHVNVGEQVEMVGIFVAGALGAFFASVLFDWALILLSSMAGAVLLVDTFTLQGEVELLVMIVLAVAGISIQANMLHRDKDD